MDMKSWFQARAYPSDLVQKETNKVKFLGYWDKNKAKTKSRRVPLVITFHPFLKDVGNIIQKTTICYTWTRKLKEFLRLDP